MASLLATSSVPLRCAPRVSVTAPRGGSRARFVPARAAAAAPSGGLTVDSYLPVGKANCFEKVDGKLVERFVIEPITAASLESMHANAPTSYVTVFGASLGEVLAGDGSKLPEAFANVAFCEDWRERALSAARTWLRPHAQASLLGLVPMGTSRGEWNFNIQHKRVLNFENAVSDSDNVKQDMSIDVYGREQQAEDTK